MEGWDSVNRNGIGYQNFIDSKYLNAINFINKYYTFPVQYETYKFVKGLFFNILF